MTAVSSKNKAIGDLLIRRYNLKPNPHIQKIPKGFVNESYQVQGYDENGQITWCVRCYNIQRRLSNIRFEHDLLLELPKRGFNLAPCLIRNIGGTTWETMDIPLKGSIQSQLIAVFEYMEGETPYDWDSSPIDTSSLIEAAKILAEYHTAIHDFSPRFRGGTESVTEQVKQIKFFILNRFKQHHAPQDDFHRILNHHQDFLVQMVQKLENQLGSITVQSLPHLVIHGDYHLGNCRFLEDKIIGLLDFDWSRKDARVFDIALGLTYLCWPFSPTVQPRFSYDVADIFLSEYILSATQAGKSPMKPLSMQERCCLFPMMALGHFIMIFWTIADYETHHTQTPKASIKCLNHAISALQFMDQNATFLQNYFIGQAL